ncbi:MAG TPA: hypothetical protein PLY93_12550 [Turneriella sp.]|nr:hypothetical protein [Turneriella sp.]
MRFLAIFFFIGIFLSATHTILAGTRAPLDKPRFKVLDEQVDLLLLRNTPRYLVEGIGGAGMLLGETETKLRRFHGEPAYRDFASPETLYYSTEKFSGAFILKHGRIYEIRLEIEKNKSPSLEWFTALGLHESDVRGKDTQDVLAFATKFYRTRRVRQVGDKVDVFGRGIEFQLRGKSIIFVVIRAAEPYSDLRTD